MTVDILLGVLGWSAVINMGLLLWWFLWFMFAHDFMYRMQSRWFKISVEKFDALNYAGMAFHKITIIVFNVVPYLALRIIT
jgi:hypothetical protein